MEQEHMLLALSVRTEAANQSGASSSDGCC
jgi:hypothetical protein